MAVLLREPVSFDTISYVQQILNDIYRFVDCDMLMRYLGGGLFHTILRGIVDITVSMREIFGGTPGPVPEAQGEDDGDVSGSDEEMVVDTDEETDDGIDREMGEKTDEDTDAGTDAGTDQDENEDES